MVAMPSALVPTSRSSASAALPPEARTSASPTPRVVGTAAKMVRPEANSGGVRGNSRKAKPRKGVSARIPTKPYTMPGQ